ncbi:MAG TPA: tyrosine-type recombinase/integrase [Acidimicrobiales bacterium]|jgi:integrase
MASIDKLPNGKYRARWRTPDGASRCKHFDRRADARRHLATVEHTKATGAYVDARAGRVTFRAYAEEWRAAQVHRPSTAAQVEGNLRRHAYPALGDRPIAAIRPSHVQAWVRGLADTLAPATVEVVYRYVAAIFRAAVADRVVATSPAARVTLPRAERATVEPLAVEAVEAIAAALPPRYRALVALAAGTGLRQGEAFGLTVDRVDFLRRTVRVDRQLLLLPGGPPTLAPPKTEASRRTVPLPSVVVDALAAHLAAYPAGPDGHVFTDEAGRPIRRNRFGEVWRAAVRAVGVPVGADFHALRHFYASLLIRHGESVKVVQDRLGHASAAETLDTYSHLWPDAEDRTRAAVDAVLGVGVMVTGTEGRARR